MNFIKLPGQERNSDVEVGKLLIAEPLLSSSDFSRTVILICKHDEEGTIGFVLNQPTAYLLSDILPAFSVSETKLFIGGPVETNTMYVIHRLPDELGGIYVSDGIYWGCAVEELNELLKSGRHITGQVCIFMGYSGWSSGQLEAELKEGNWLVADANEHFVFETTFESMWKLAIALLGKNLSYLANVPINPHLN